MDIKELIKKLEKLKKAEQEKNEAELIMQRENFELKQAKRKYRTRQLILIGSEVVSMFKEKYGQDLLDLDLALYSKMIWQMEYKPFR